VNARLVAFASVVSLLAGPVVSQAAAKPKPVCHLIPDAPDDTSPVPADSLELLSADIASDARRLTAVFRVKQLADTEPTAPLGRIYQVNLIGQGGTTYAFLSYFVTPAGGAFKYGYRSVGSVDEAKGAATGKIDSARNEIRVTVPVAALSALPGVGSFKAGARITSIQVRLSRWHGAYVDDQTHGGVDSEADTALASRNYLGGTPSCVKP
jgi:hypothetical protein